MDRWLDQMTDSTLTDEEVQALFLPLEAALCGHDSCGLLCDKRVRFDASPDQPHSGFNVGGDHGRSAVVEQLSQGYSLTRAAARLRVPVRVVTSVFIHDDPADVLAAEAMLNEGIHSCGAVARATGLHRRSVLRLANALGVELVAKQYNVKHDADDVSAIAALQAQGWSVRAIATELQMSKTTVSRLGQSALSLSA